MLLNVARTQIRFKSLGKQPCPACRDRGALNTWDRPVWHRGQKLTWGCEYCDGEGVIDAFLALNDWPVGDFWFRHEVKPSS